MFEHILKEDRISVLWLGEPLEDLHNIPRELQDNVLIEHVSRPDLAMQMLREHEFKVVVIHLNNDDFAFRYKWLRKLVVDFPGVIRVMLNDRLQAHQVAKASELCHRSMLFSSGIRDLMYEVGQCFRTSNAANKPVVRDYVGGIKRLPSMPAIYIELNDALASDATGAAEIAAIVEQDPAMSAKILQLVNSAFFALSSHVFKIKDAVVILGVRQIRDLFLVSRLFDHYPQDKNWTSFSFENLFDRCMVVGRFARAICREHRVAADIADKAFLAALLQDLGMLVIATRDAEKYSEVMREAAGMNQPLYAIEKLRLGVNHMEVGACILGLWNLPPEVTEAVLYHSHPNSTAGEKFTPLTAVHIADSILPDVVNVNDCRISSRISESYLKKLGLQDKLSHWQEMSEEFALQLYSGVGKGF
ncbi:HDOD domain-containing protein [Amphritea balenae]|uniref:HDOD domain-containing protein n=1 Tax=Amphritea balenae TaxID=452629 RepID=A0A3P1ST60_9GAMM|nr:HDOD domain-containing protein [Amphritea balenae]RRD00379.1 HDOD domain-containing protein [Amphritea balenae]GGK85935.1 two-component system response regulator [Amphritea balenae]